MLSCHVNNFLHDCVHTLCFQMKDTWLLNLWNLQNIHFWNLVLKMWRHRHTSVYVTMNHFCNILHITFCVCYLQPSATICWPDLELPLTNALPCSSCCTPFQCKQYLRQQLLFNLAVRILSPSSSFHNNVTFMTYLHNDACSACRWALLINRKQLGAKS